MIWSLCAPSLSSPKLTTFAYGLLRSGIDRASSYFAEVFAATAAESNRNVFEWQKCLYCVTSERASEIAVSLRWKKFYDSQLFPGSCPRFESLR